VELDDCSLPTGRGEWEDDAQFRLADAHFDDGYDRLDEGPVFSVSAGDREIRVILGGGYRAAQVFSPPGAPFICFEPMVAPANAFCLGDRFPRVVPGDSFTAAFRIDVRQSSSRAASHSAWRARSS
jgi:aldose 1-epimerase